MGEEDPTPLSEYFSGLASGYARHRPTYPAACIDAILKGLEPPVRAADIGCGTGISTRLLAERGVEVIGIDPNDDMLAAAGSVPTPTAVYREGVAESTGLADGTVDLVMCAQAFHWFDTDAALEEFHRVLRPGGRFAAMWNVRSTTHPVGREYERIIRRAQAAAVAEGRKLSRGRRFEPTRGDLFEVMFNRRFENPSWHDVDGLLGRARSASYFPRDEALRAELERELVRLFEAEQEDGRVCLLEVTDLTLAVRREMK